LPFLSLFATLKPVALFINPNLPCSSGTKSATITLT